MKGLFVCLFVVFSIPSFRSPFIHSFLSILPFFIFSFSLYFFAFFFPSFLSLFFLSSFISLFLSCLSLFSFLSLFLSFLYFFLPFFLFSCFLPCFISFLSSFLVCLSFFIFLSCFLLCLFLLFCVCSLSLLSETASFCSHILTKWISTDSVTDQNDSMRNIFTVYESHFCSYL